MIQAEIASNGRSFGVLRLVKSLGDGHIHSVGLHGGLQLNIVFVLAEPVGGVGRLLGVLLLIIAHHQVSVDRVQGMSQFFADVIRDIVADIFGGVEGVISVSVVDRLHVWLS